MVPSEISNAIARLGELIAGVWFASRTLVWIEVAQTGLIALCVIALWRGRS